MSRRILRILVPALLLLATASSAAAYPWPIKPFDRQHPIRGFFGDPRTRYLSGILADAFDGPGFFSFHQGVDISAPNGTPIYPVATGVAHYLGAATLNVNVSDDLVFQYFHIVPVVGEGQTVIARKTILGYVQAPYQHVHLTEIDSGHAVNPLQRGHLTPYVDHTKPVVRQALFANLNGTLQTPLGLCGRVELTADAYDTPPKPVPGTFRGLPVAPALVRWEIARLNGKPVVPWHTAADFRTTLPGNADFAKVYARGTYENAPRFGAQQYPSMPGRYLFLLSGSFDTTALANGAYELRVRASDVRSNGALLTTRFSVLNAHKGVCPGTLPAPPSTAPPPTEPPSSAPPTQP